MRLDLTFFAWVREQMGRGSESADVPDSVQTVAELIGWLAARDAGGAAAFAEPARIRAAVDGAMCSLDAPLAGAREIALFPPVTGG